MIRSEVRSASVMMGLDASTKASGVKSLTQDVLADIFGYLPMKSKLACRAACRQWKDVTDNIATVWTTNVLLRGDLSRIDRQWLRLHTWTRDARIRSLNLQVLTPSIPSNLHRYKLEDKLRYWSILQFPRSFPFETLEEFRYTNREEDTIVHEQVWTLLTQCKKLDILHWDEERAPYLRNEPFYFEIEGTPLANCRLTEFIFASFQNIRFDKLFADMLSRAKKIHLDALLQRGRVRQILWAAKDAVEDLLVKDTIWRPHEKEAELESMVPLYYGTIHMTKLHKFEAVFQPPSPPADLERIYGSVYDLVAPQLIQYRAWGSQMMDYTLLESCLSNVVKLDWFSGDMRRFNSVLQRQLLCMPKCEILMLMRLEEIFRWLPEVGDQLGHDQFTTGYNISLRQVLPKLRILQIEHDKVVTGEKLINWLQSRKRYGLAPLEEVILMHCPRIKAGALLKLRELVPSITHTKVCKSMQTSEEHEDHAPVFS